jgi:hypothetical protein
MALVSVLVLTAGCATVAHGTRQAVVVTSEPSGAQVFVNAKPVGVTPVRLELTRRSTKAIIRFETDGFATKEIVLKHSVSGWILGDVAFANPLAGQGLNSRSEYPMVAAEGLAFGFGIDFLTGAAFRFPKTVNITLERPGAKMPRP